MGGNNKTSNITKDISSSGGGGMSTSSNTNLRITSSSSSYANTSPSSSTTHHIPQNNRRTHNAYFTPQQSSLISLPFKHAITIPTSDSTGGIGCGICLWNESKTKCLLVQQRSTQKWGFPKGACEVHESRLQCMKRELREETGIILDDLKYKTVIELKRFRYYIFFVQLLQDETSIVIKPVDGYEIQDAQWVSCQEAMTELNLNRVTQTCLTAIQQEEYNC